MSLGWPGLDNFDPLSSLGKIPTGRAASQFPVLPEDEEETMLGGLKRQGLSALGYYGSTVDKFGGGRSVRALLDTLAGSGKHARDIASILPFSETLGLTSPEEAVSGAQLVKNVSRNVTGEEYDPEKGTWFERNIVGPGVEMALDPTTYLGGVGALTKAGQAAEKLGKVPRFWQPGFLEAVGRGERTAIHGLTGPTVASGLEAMGTGLGRGNEILRKLPLVAPAEDLLSKAGEQALTVGRGLFSAPHGFSTDPLVQASRAAILHPGEEAADVAARGAYADLFQRQKELVAGGLDPEGLQRYLRQKAEILTAPPTGAAPEMRALETGHFFDPEFLASMSPEVRAQADAIAAEMRRQGGEIPLQREREAGYAGAELQDPMIHYSYRQQNLTTPQGVGPEKDWLGRAKALPVDLGKERLEALTGRPGGTIQLEDILHTPGMAGPTAMPLQGQIREILRSDLGLPPTAEFSPLHPQFGGQYTAPAAQSAEELAKLARAIPQERLFSPTGEAIPYFNPDLVQGTAKRLQRAGRSATTADTILDIIGKAQVAKGTDTVPVKDVLGSLKLDTEVGYRRALEAIGEDPDRILARAFPQPPGAKALSNQEILAQALESYHLPSGTAKGMTDLLQRFTTPHEWGPVGKWLKEVTGATKRGLYSIWPSAHGRNYESGVAENLKDFGLKPFTQPYHMTEQALLGEAVDTKIPMFAGLSEQAQSDALRNLAYQYRIIGAETGEHTGRVLPFTGDPLAKRQSAVDIIKETIEGAKKGEWRVPWAGEVVDPVTGQVTKGPAVGVKMGQAFNQLVEERVRLAPFAYLLQQGYTPEMAAAKVFGTHYDYERGVSEFMKNVGSQAMLFPTFTSQNVPKQFLQSIESPGKQMGPVRFSGAMRPEEEGAYTPQYLQEGGLAIPLPSEGLPEGQQRYLTRVGLPMEEAFGHVRMGPTTLSTLQKTAQGFLSMVNPVLKTPLEWATGRQLHTGRELADLYPGAVPSLGGLLPQDVTVAAQEALGATPAGRLASTVNRLLDPRKMTPVGAAGTLAGLASGLRVSDVDQAKWESIDAMNQLRELMARSPHMRKSVDYYVPQEMKGQLTPEETEQIRGMKTLQKEAREAKKQKVGLQTLSQANM